MESLLYLFIALGSLGGAVFIVYKKIPLLLALSQDDVKTEDFLQKGIGKVASFPKQRLEKALDLTLSRTRSLAHKTEVQAAGWLEELRKKSETRKAEFEESYWDHLRKKRKGKN